MMTAKSLAGILLFIILVLTLAGCDGDGSNAIDATLADLWPNEDGRQWIYDLRYSASTVPLDVSLTSVDSLPPISQMYEIMLSVDPPEPSSTHSAVLRNRFEGEVTTASGVTGQRLVCRFDSDERSGSGRSLALADVPLGITGRCWVMTDDRIVGYEDESSDPHWLYLKTPLEVGAVFDQRIWPGNQDESYIQGQYVRSLNWRQGGHVYSGAVEVFTLIDMGLSSLEDDDGEPSGTHRSFICDRTIFAPGVGPVYCREWWAMMIRTAYDPIGHPLLIEYEAVLVETAIPEG